MLVGSRARQPWIDLPQCTNLAARGVFGPHGGRALQLHQQGYCLFRPNDPDWLALIDLVRFQLEPLVDLSEWQTGADALNQALRKANSEWIGWLNADDLYAPGCLNRALKALDQQPHWQMIYGHGQHVDAHGNFLELYPSQPPSIGAQGFQQGCFICQPTVLLHKQLLEQVGGWDPSWRCAFDVDLWLGFLSQPWSDWLHQRAASLHPASQQTITPTGNGASTWNTVNCFFAVMGMLRRIGSKQLPKQGSLPIRIQTQKRMLPARLKP